MAPLMPRPASSMECYAVYCHVDTTEGRMGMRLHSIWPNRGEATTFANAQCGIMGRRPDTGDWTTYRGGADWEIHPLRTFDELIVAVACSQRGAR